MRKHVGTRKPDDVLLNIPPQNIQWLIYHIYLLQNCDFCAEIATAKGSTHYTFFLSTLGTLGNKTNTGSQACGDYILIFREWKRWIDRLTDKNTARWIDGWMDGWIDGWMDGWMDR